MVDQSEMKNAITIFGKLDRPMLDQPDASLTIDLTAIETRIEPPQAETTDQPEAAPKEGGVRWWKMSPLAASIALAGLLGVLAGAAATATLVRSTAAPATAATALSDETRTLRERVVRLSDELAALKSSLEAAGRTSASQLNRIGERLDRAEKAQAEPAMKLARISESLERLERRSAAAATPDITGAVTTVEKQQAKPPALEGWKLRDYYAGRAVVESRDGTLFDVVPGATLPGVGKVETIKRVDGKVVVTTPKGIITSSLEPPRRLPHHLPPGY